jgi:SET domain-containing protein
MKPRLSRFAKKLVKDLEENIYCRLMPSKISGVGVFAMRDIPKGAELFKTFLDYQLTPIPMDLIANDKKISKEIKDFACDMYPIHQGNLYAYRAGLNAIDISFFINHSDHPNVATKKDNGSFFAARKIKKGEELFSDYRTYSEETARW